MTAIPKDLAVLSSKSASQAERLVALKYLGHWVGDIHQPLHVSFEDDRGGNSIRVTGDCRPNLHSAWDTCLVVAAVGSDYIQANAPIVREQLQKAGVRLAHLLDSALGK